MDEVTLVTRSCSKCLQEKPIEAFGPSKMHKDGRRRECRSCVNARQRNIYRSNPEIRRKILDNAKKYTDANPEVWKRRYLMRVYNITLEEYNAVLTEQGGVCAICSKPEEIKNPSARERSSLAVDHCHETGKIRGLLCFKCNTGIGALGDSVEGLERALAYLRGSDVS